MPRLPYREHLARKATLALVRAWLAWDFGKGPAAPYVEAHAAWLVARSHPSLAKPRRSRALELRRVSAIGDELFVERHAFYAGRAAEGRDARLDVVSARSRQVVAFLQRAFGLEAVA
jgi:hypothetical protein